MNIKCLCGQIQNIEKYFITAFSKCGCYEFAIADHSYSKSSPRLVLFLKIKLPNNNNVSFYSDGYDEFKFSQNNSPFEKHYKITLFSNPIDLTELYKKYLNIINLI